MLPCRVVAIGSDLTERHRLRKGLTTMQIRARMSMSADGYVTTPSGWPALTADPAFVSGESHGIREFLEGCEAALMGRTTFEPALNNDRWPWPTLNVFVLASRPSVRNARPRRRRQRPGAAAGEDPRRQPGPRRPSRRRPAHDRGLPRARSARQARAGRAAPALRRRDAADAVAQPRHGDDPRARARPPRRLGRARLRRQRARRRGAGARGRAGRRPRSARPDSPGSVAATAELAQAARRSSARSWAGGLAVGEHDDAPSRPSVDQGGEPVVEATDAQRTVGDRESVGHDGILRVGAEEVASHGVADEEAGNRGHASSVRAERHSFKS